MGTGQELRRRPIGVVANFVMKLQIAAIKAMDDSRGECSVSLYPMIDGVYAVTANRKCIVEWVNSTFGLIAEHFLQDNQRDFRFIVRGGIAYGPVVPGTDLTGGSRLLTENPELRSRVLIGPPLAQAYDAERSAPPFGVVVHESAVNSAPRGETPLGGPLFKWWGDGDSARTNLARKLRPELISELKGRAAVTSISGYPEKKLASHIALIETYLPEQPELPW